MRSAGEGGGEDAMTTAPSTATTAYMTPVSDRVSLPEQEEAILAFWKDIDAFQTSLKMSEGKPDYTFYDGPPFATGLPHYGHILAGTIKDVVTRYAHQTGHHVPRRFGWDCHGLPVEFEIDKTLGIRGKEDVLQMGIAAYNDECRAIVQRYSGEWQSIVERMGRWIDFDNSYKTMEPWYMESVWWAFKTLHEKGLVYRGYKVMPYSMACGTPLSNFEANLEYTDVTDPSIVVSFPVTNPGQGEEGAALVTWTTTPWTLTSNLALCVNPKLKYVRVRDTATGKAYILSADRLEMIYPKKKKQKKKKTSKDSDQAADGAAANGEDTVPYVVEQEYVGEELVGRTYEPLFDYFKTSHSKSAFRVVSDQYVSADDGTGVMHQAPAFGEDDFRVCLDKGIFSLSEELPCPIDTNGRFTDQVTELAGINVKDADSDVTSMIKLRDRLVKQDTLCHSYPFCWRSHTPLIYRAVPSWFVAVEKIKDRLVERNDETMWVPSYVREKRFRNWLEGAMDWCVSRDRFWGTPMPIWRSDDWEEVVVVGSIEELQRLTGKENLTDIHRQFIDGLTIPSKQGKGELRRVEDVFDCWFESGAMPYAQSHYPFEIKDKFESGFPADFVAEGLDQTRGWFYTLTVLSVALFDRPAFKNCVVNGLVLAEDSKKISSKSLKNYPDPNDVIDQFGSDALRLYLINSPAVTAERLLFKEDGVKDVVKSVLLPWHNAYRFLVMSALAYTQRTGKRFAAEGMEMSTVDGKPCGNVMDQWIMAASYRLVGQVHDDMEALRLDQTAAGVVRYIEDLANWYIQFNRARLKGEEGTQEECLDALSSLFHALLTLSRLMSPITPFICECMYQNLKVCLPAEAQRDSIHYLMLPEPNEELMDAEVEARVRSMQSVILMGRAARERRGISLETPLPSVLVVHPDQAVLDGLQSFETYIKSQLNVKEVTHTNAEQEHVRLSAKLDFKEAGKRFGADAKKVAAAVEELSAEEVKEYERTGSLEVCGQTLAGADIQLNREYQGDSTKFEAGTDGLMTTVLDVVWGEALQVGVEGRGTVVKEREEGEVVGVVGVVGKIK